MADPKTLHPVVFYDENNPLPEGMRDFRPKRVDPEPSPDAGEKSPEIAPAYRRRVAKD